MTSRRGTDEEWVEVVDITDAPMDGLSAADRAVLSTLDSGLSPIVEIMARSGLSVGRETHRRILRRLIEGGYVRASGQGVSVQYARVAPDKPEKLPGSLVDRLRRAAGIRPVVDPTARIAVLEARVADLSAAVEMIAGMLGA